MDVTYTAILMLTALKIVVVSNIGNVLQIRQDTYRACRCTLYRSKAVYEISIYYEVVTAPD
jgi:hypothetical protein